MSHYLFNRIHWKQRQVPKKIKVIKIVLWDKESVYLQSHQLLPNLHNLQVPINFQDNLTQLAHLTRTVMNRNSQVLQQHKEENTLNNKKKNQWFTQVLLQLSLPSRFCLDQISSKLCLQKLIKKEIPTLLLGILINQISSFLNLPQQIQKTLHHLLHLLERLLSQLHRRNSWSSKFPLIKKIKFPLNNPLRMFLNHLYRVIIQFLNQHRCLI